MAQDKRDYSRKREAMLPVAEKIARVDASAADSTASRLFGALSSPTRIAILRYLGDDVVPLTQIADALDLPSSTATMHVSVLEKAGLLQTEMRPARRGLQKVCARTYDQLVVALPRSERPSRSAIDVSIPIGSYSEFDVEPTCGMASATGLVGFLDDPNTFYEPDRLKAQLIWFRAGFLEYRLPNRLPPTARLHLLELSAEICSEAPLHDPEWPSDISVWVNGVELGAWTSPGDFGGQRGYLTPIWWPQKDSQFGALKRWKVTASGTTIDGLSVSDVSLDALALRPGEAIKVRIGVRPDAVHPGGMNLFGRGFGNYPQDLELRIEFEAPAAPSGPSPASPTSRS